MENKHKYSMANHGIPVTGERLIGRDEQIKEIERRIIDSAYGPGNLALIGLPGIGKRSIIFHALWARREELFARENPVLVININLVSCTYYGDFFYLLFTSCREELIIRNRLTKPVERVARDLLVERHWGDTSPAAFKNFFKAVRQQGISTLFILENFDFVDELFRNDIANFDFLRELATQPYYGVKLVALLQCTLKELGPRTQNIAISKFSQSFGVPCFVSMFNDAEMHIYFERLASFGLTITDTVKAYIEACCGRHPYLLEMFGDAIDGLQTLAKPGEEPDIHEAGRKIESSIVTYIDDLIQQLRRRGMFNNLVQAVAGPTSTVKEIEIKTLCDYGLIKPAPEPREAGTPEYVAFCTYLQEFLATSELDAPTHIAALVSWVVLRDQTENTLRYAAETILRNEYGDDWLTIMETTHPDFLRHDGRNLFRYCREKAATIHSNTTKPFKNLLGHTTMRELFDLILLEWSCFGTLFDESESEWNHRFYCIGEVRNEEAHSKFKYVHPEKLAEAEKYCHEILTRLHFD